MPLAIPPDVEAEIAQFRETIRSARSDKLLRLFDYLLERTRAGQSPNETEIASDLFGDEPDLLSAGNASVRVYVHRLRKKLEEFYSSGRPARISVPQGEYSIAISDGSGAASENSEDAGKARAKRQLITVAIAFLCLSGLTIWLLASSFPGSDRADLARSPLWKPLMANGRPNLVVAGDIFLFAESKDNRGGSQLVWDPRIKNREALDVVVMRSPARKGNLRDVDAHFLSVGTSLALARLQTITLGLKRDDSTPVPLSYGSQLTSQTLKSANIIYVGSIACLPPLLRNPAFNASGLKVGSSFEELIDRASGKHFQSDGSIISEDRVATRDYGYIARLRGPSGNVIVLIMGTRDPAILQMAQLISDPSKIAVLARDLLDPNGNFEALYEVRTIGSTNVNERRLILRPVKADDVWYKATASQHFPDEVLEADLK